MTEHDTKEKSKFLICVETLRILAFMSLSLTYSNVSSIPTAESQSCQEYFVEIQLEQSILLDTVHVFLEHPEKFLLLIL